MADRRGRWASWPGQPAIDAGDNATCLATDQRGVNRPQPSGGVCDIGAFEVRGYGAEILGGSVQTATIGSQFSNTLQVRVADPNNNVVVGAAVTFTAPASGASGLFTAGAGGGAATYVTATNSSGVASALPFVANLIGGRYSVTVAALEQPATFVLTNDRAASATVLARAARCVGPWSECHLQRQRDRQCGGACA